MSTHTIDEHVGPTGWILVDKNNEPAGNVLYTVDPNMNGFAHLPRVYDLAHPEDSPHRFAPVLIM